MKLKKHFCRWITHILKKGLQKSIVEEDIYECAEHQKSEENSRKFKEIWSDELNKKSPKLVKSIIKFCGLRIFLIGIPISILELLCK